MQVVPQLSNIRQVSDGWIKKYVLAYTMPDGSTYEYESASRKSLDAYRAEPVSYTHLTLPTTERV